MKWSSALLLFVLPGCTWGWIPAPLHLRPVSQLRHQGVTDSGSFLRRRSTISQHGKAPLRPLNDDVVRKSSSEVTMGLTVLGALTAPVVTLAALGTMDGVSRVVLNIPKFLNYQYRYATSVLQRGTLNAQSPVESLKSKLLENKDYRMNALRLFVKYDADEDGLITKEELSRCLQSEFPEGLTDSAITALLDTMDTDQNLQIDAEEFLRTLYGDVSKADCARLLQEARDAKLEGAYEECKKLTSDYAKTFFLATLTMEPIQAKATWAIYAWCRRVDEIVDGEKADPDPAKQEAELEDWMNRLEAMYSGGSSAELDTFDLAFKDMLRTFPDSDVEPYRDMVRGMLMDIDDDVRYQTWDDLYEYCYRVASTVGLMTLPVMGTAAGVTLQQARQPAVALGIALQLTNILRDVGEDARDRSRIYLPLEDLHRFGVTEEYIFDLAKNGGEVSDNYKELMKFEIARAESYYEMADSGIPMLSKGAQLPVAVAGQLYREILRQLEVNDYDNFNKRAFVSKERKLLAVPQLWLKTLTGGFDRTSAAQQPLRDGAKKEFSDAK
mmetsp:Transcript_22125/g.45117  ORF Transcript_22125/g.45117 Transcript_22125/m.45117 type:complete len:554 (+) Transcript_22125:181-1842(+)